MESTLDLILLAGVTALALLPRCRHGTTRLRLSIFAVAVLLAGLAHAGDTMVVSMADLWESGLAHNEGLLARGQVLSADSTELRGHYGSYFPELSAQAGYSYLDIIPSTKVPFVGNQPHDMLGSFNLRQNIYDGGRRSAQLHLLQAKLSRSDALLAQARLDLKLEIALRYHRLQLLDVELSVLEENLAGIEAQLDLTRLLARAGRISSVEEGRHEAMLLEIESRINSTRADRSATVLNLCQLAGISFRAELLPADSIAETKPGFLPDSALVLGDKNHPLLKAWAAQLDQSRAAITAARSAQMPSLALQAWYGWEFWNAGFTFDDNKRYGAGVVANVPLFDGLRTASAVRAAELRRRSTESDAGYYRSGLHVRIQNTLGSIAAANEQVASLRRATELARLNLDMALAEYLAGRRTSTDVLQLRTALLESQLRLSRQLVQQADLVVTARHLLGIL
ncbi:TolC family protein [candidate division WOR-3 bacterium]|nr:TolC family protein [candidate division WOR-3 bacterium]